MKPPALRWASPTSLAEAVGMLGDFGGEAKVIAGGQSLMPLLALRMASPGTLIDVDRLHELDFVTVHGSDLYLGALVRHRRMQHDPAIGSVARLLPVVAGHIGHVAIRNRGTLGGSLAHADPAAELPAAMVLLNASVVCLSRRGRREVPAAGFATGPYTTVLDEDELVAGVRIPLPDPGSRFGFCEVAPRSGDFARAGAMCRAVLDHGGRIESLQMVLFAVTPTPTPLDSLPAAVIGLPGIEPHRGADAGAAAGADAVAGAVAGAVAEAVEQGSASLADDYARRVSGVVAIRALRQAVGSGAIL